MGVTESVTSRPLVLAAALMAAMLAGCNDSGPSYRSCDEVRAAGKAPLHKGDPGYRSSLDRDGDGVACDE